MERAAENIDPEEMESLVEGARSGDQHVLSRLIRLLYPRVYRYVYYRVDNRQDVEDITNDVFARMLDALEHQHGSFWAWLYSIASNRITDFYRKSAVRSQVTEVGDTIEYFRDGANPLDSMFLREELRKAIRQLTEEQQEVILLRFIEGYQATEVAELLSKTPEAVRALQFRALKQLRKMMPVE